MSSIRVVLPGRSVLTQDQGNRYTSEQRQDYSVSTSFDEKKARSRESSQQRVQQPRSSSRRDKKTDSGESPLFITIIVLPAALLSPASIDDDDDRNDDDGHEDDGHEGNLNDGDDNDNSDNDSSPTLECTAQLPDLPQDTSVLHIPGKKAKRPGSSLEEKLEIRETSPKATGNNPKVPQSKKVKYDIVPEVNEMSKEDQIDLDLEDNVDLDSEDETDPDPEDQIANLPIDNSFDAHESLNGDDLLLILEEMINN